MEYFSKKEIVDIYTDKRDILKTEEVEDLLNCFLEYTLKKIKERGTYSIAYNLESLGQFYEKEFDTRDLIKSVKETSRIKAEKKMHEYILNNITKPKEIKIENDPIHRI